MLYEKQTQNIIIEPDDYTNYVGCSIELINGTPFFEYFYDEETDDAKRIETMLNSKGVNLLYESIELKKTVSQNLYQNTYNKPVITCSRSDSQIQYYVDVKEVSENSTKGLWDVTRTTIVTPRGGWRTYSVNHYIYADYRDQLLRDYGPDSSATGSSYKVTAGLSASGPSVSVSYDFGMSGMEKRITYLPQNGNRDCSWYYAVAVGSEAATSSHTYRSTLRFEGSNTIMDCNVSGQVSLNRAFWTLGWHWSIVSGDMIDITTAGFIISIRNA